MDKKNILIVISSLKHWGGAERVSSTIWTKLYEEWYNIRYLTFYNAENKYKFKWQEICLNEKPSNNILINFVKLFIRARKIKKHCKKYLIDVSLSFMEESNFPNILSKLFFRNKSKILVSIRQSVDFMPKIYQLFIKIFYKKSDIVIPNSQEEANNLVYNYNVPIEKVKTIYNPLNIELIQNKSKEEISNTYENLFKQKLFSFISVWRLTKQKNQRFLIDCFLEFNKKYSCSQLLFLWDWEMELQLKNYSQNKNIKILWNQENVYQFLVKSDCFIFSSLWEGFPNAVLEAMACWVPIISTKFKTWISEILKENKYWLLTSVDNKNEFISAMENIYLDANLRLYYKQKSLERANDFQIDKILNLWKKIL